MLIQRVYEVNPLTCPKCGAAMKIIAFVEARQDDVIRKILEHCGLWREAPARAPPRAAQASRPFRTRRGSDSTTAVEVDPDFLEHLRHASEAE